ncbi:MAG: response regulator [Geobacter sp.]|nr:MAG: response regulator [Geobacter sp.]
MKECTMQRLLPYFFLIMLLLAGCSGEKGNPNAVLGFLDLSRWDFTKDGIVNLNGEWEFYWNHLYSPSDVAGPNPPAKTGYFSIPQYWNGATVSGSALPGSGYATFRLRVKLKQGQQNLAIRIEDQATAYRLWVNGSEVAGNGVAGTDARSTKPYFRITTASFPVGGQYLDCLLQVSNFQLARGGPYRKIALGSPDVIGQRQATLFAIDLLLFGILGIIGIYHISFYLLRRNDPSPLYFGACCLTWAIGIPFGAVGGRFITLFFPEVHWYWLGRMELLTWFPTVPLMLLFFTSSFPEEYSAKVTRFAVLTGAGFFVFALLAPSRFLGYTEIPYEVFSLVIAAYIVVMLVRAMMRKRTGAALMLAGFLVFLGTVVNDILYVNLVIYSVYLVSAGYAVMVLIQSLAISRRFARSFSAVESLTAELEEKNIALSRLDILKNEFLANTSHELRTPLNGIIGIAESLVAGVSGKLHPKTEQNLAMIVSSGRRLAGLVDDILDFSRLRNNDIQLRRQAVDICSVTEMVLAVMKPLAAGKPVVLRNALPVALPPVWGDEDRLQQILYNLVGNAVKFTDQGEIRISAVQEGPVIVISVADTGIGIPRDKHEAIFRSFEQVDASDARAYGGAGLGLAITRNLVELHGGRITLESEPGSGAVFSFSIPAVRDYAEGPLDQRPLELLSQVSPAFHDAADTGPAPNLPGFDKTVRIIVVDDDPVNRQVVTNHLSFANVEVISAGSGMLAIGIIESSAVPDLILLDIMMPRMTGYEVCRWLRERYTPSEVPVIMLTAKNGTSDLVQCFSLGANDYLVKPFSQDELLARVTSQLKLLDAYRTLRENLSLRQQLEERRQSELELQMVQRQLSRMLDTIDDALLAINESDEITFCNRAAEEVLFCKADEILGKPFGTAVQFAAGGSFPEAVHDAFRHCFDGNANRDLGVVSLERIGGTVFKAHVVLSPLNLEDNPVCLIVLRPCSAGRPAGHAGQNVEHSLAVIRSLNENRARLQSITASLNGLLPLIDEQEPGFLQGLAAIDEALDRIGKTILDEESYKSRRHLAVEVMNCALDYWTESTGLAKNDLASRSKLWKIYTNVDGWERTQTLDRYLNIDTFPQKPQWIKVMKTADYVLANGKMPSVLRARLEALLMQLRVRR